MILDRLLARFWPRDWPIAYQWWGKLLFAHWPVPAAAVRPLIPERLELDTFGGTAWVSITPLTIWGMRPTLLPSAPVVGATHELNVRTYVTFDGEPGVWFFSLDATNPLAVWGARLMFGLPYHHAVIGLEEDGQAVHFRSRRAGMDGHEASFEARWARGAPLPPSRPGSPEFFLTERYCLFTGSAGRLYRARIRHRPWPQCRATLHSLDSTMAECNGLPTPAGPPLVHAQAEPLRVGVLPPEAV